MKFRPMSRLILALAALVAPAAGQEPIPPRRVEVLPVFFVPRGEAVPTSEQAEILVRHLQWSQRRYRELLHDQATFAIAGSKPHIHHAQHDLAYYRAQPHHAVEDYVSELLAALQTDRYRNPYVLLVVVMSPAVPFPVGAAQPINGGINTGGGIAHLSSYDLDRSPNFQSTLQHELGHSFGLPHVNVYHYDMRSNPSFMSYNPRHHTAWFEPSTQPGALIAEDRRGLALNQRVFPGLRFDPARDVPPGYQIAEPIVTLGAMGVPGQPVRPRFATKSGEEHGGKVSHLDHGRIGTNRPDGAISFDPATMWHSARSESGWVVLRVEFPVAVELTGLTVHSQHGGRYHIAQEVKISVETPDGAPFHPVAETALKSADDSVTFPPTRGRVWHLEFRGGESQTVVIRGLQFFRETDELFPPLLPYQP